MCSTAVKFRKRGLCTVLWFVADVPVAHQQNWRYTGWRKLDKENNQCIREKNGSTEHSKGNKTIPGKLATTRTEE